MCASATGQSDDDLRQLRFTIRALFKYLGLSQSQRTANIQALGREGLNDLSADDLRCLRDSLAARTKPNQHQTLAKQFPKGFELSDLYRYLGKNQRTILEVARTIEKRFARGRTVDRGMLRRIAHRYHGIPKNGVRRAIQRLLTIGVIGTTPGGDIQLLPTAADLLTERQNAELERMQNSAEQIAPLLEAATTMLPDVSSVSELIGVIDRVGILLKA